MEGINERYLITRLRRPSGDTVHMHSLGAVCGAAQLGLFHRQGKRNPEGEIVCSFASKDDLKHFACATLQISMLTYFTIELRKLSPSLHEKELVFRNAKSSTRPFSHYA